MSGGGSPHVVVAPRTRTSEQEARTLTHVSARKKDACQSYSSHLWILHFLLVVVIYIGFIGLYCSQNDIAFERLIWSINNGRQLFEFIFIIYFVPNN